MFRCDATRVFIALFFACFDLLAMRLTADLINGAPQFFNPLREREIDLRGMFHGQLCRVCVIVANSNSYVVSIDF